jgi:DNA-binding NtrC family response regulator
VKGRILVIDDEAAMLEACQETLTHHGYDVVVHADADEGLAAAARQSFDAVLLDLKMPGRSGLDVLRDLQRLDENVQKVMITAFPTISTAVEAVREGAFDYLPKPFSPDQLLITMERAVGQKRLSEENQRLRRALGLHAGFEGIIARSPAMARVLELVERVASTDSSVVIEGETGTGKELIARSLHANSARRERPFLPIDCGALPDNLLENELFGHERGAFTGADRRKPGLLEAADGGTVFLDEVANLSLDLQVKLLRALQERRVRRLGGSEDFDVDFRLISAANENLEASMQAGRFRQDLFYRLNVVHLELPPLREREGDIVLLAEHFVERFNERDKQVAGLTKGALDVLEGYSWPGNVRELQNAVESAHSLCPGDHIHAEDLPARVQPGQAPQPLPDDFAEARGRFEREYLTGLLQRCEGNVTRAARQSGLHRSTLQRLLRRHGLTSDSFR